MKFCVVLTVGKNGKIVQIYFLFHFIENDTFKSVKIAFEDFLICIFF